MAPKLYATLISPPTRAVLMTADVLGVKLELVILDLLAGDQYKEEFLKINPAHTVPVLVDDDGFVVIDSHAINGYLVAKYGKDDALYPKDYKLRSNVDHKLHFDSSFFFIRGLNISKPLVFRNGIQPDQDRLDALTEAFEVVDKFLEQSGSTYIASNQLTIADFSFLTSITQWDIFIPYSNYLHIKAYIERLKKLPFYKLNNEGLQEYNKLISSALKS